MIGKSRRGVRVSRFKRNEGGGGELVRESQLNPLDEGNENEETVVGAVREFEVER